MARTRNDNSNRTADMMLALRAQLEERLEQCTRLMQNGVEIIDPATTYIGVDVEVGPETVIYPNTTITGESIIGRRCVVGPNSIVVDSRIGDGCEIFASVVEGAALEAGVDIGPFSHVRPDSYIETGVHVGNFVEIKASHLSEGTKAGHFSYIGDARVGRNVNIGAGTVTCNYDGKAKHQTLIEDNVFIGSGTMLVAPVRVGRGASTGAGSVVTRDVPRGARVFGVPAQAAPESGDGKRKGLNTARSAARLPGKKNG
jgi:bifunctional UDP-N-acetylglucosamine pyrophosphorylase/glucosamine-1-phosphate N-acetyltransferase